MLDIKIQLKNGKKVLSTSIKGKSILTIPQLNKGTAFSEQERRDFGIMGKLPIHVETIGKQMDRALVQYNMCDNDIARNIYLNRLHDSNTVLFYAFVGKHLKSMLPMLYTPIVGKAVQQFSHKFRNARGLYVSYHEREYISETLDNRSNPDIDLIVVTDGEGVLGIGDQGIGGMDIPIAKLMVYTLCGGINPLRTLPIMLDVGTNNKALSDDPLYFGDRRPRLSGHEYDAFIEKFVSEVKTKFPNALLHWEDFGRGNAYRILNKYRDQLCTFNDDIQGTATVATAAILSAVNATDLPLKDHRIVIFGAGSAGMGITKAIHDAICRHDVSDEDAKKCFYLIDRQGLLTEETEDLTEEQQTYVRSRDEFTTGVSLAKTVALVKPTILIGCSARTGAFSEDIVKDMAQHCERPIIFPLSNPNNLCEATPEQLINWTDAKAIIAAGSPFDNVIYNDKEYRIAQSNNALIFPGIGLGALAVKASKITDDMLWAASVELSNHSPIRQNKTDPVLPEICQAKDISKHVAIAVAKQAMESGLAREPQDDLEQRIDDMMWVPEYLEFEAIS